VSLPFRHTKERLPDTGHIGDMLEIKVMKYYPDHKHEVNPCM